MYSSKPNTLSYRVSLFAAFLCLSFVQTGQSAPKVFQAEVDEDVRIERVYEVLDISFTILETSEADSFLQGGKIKGATGLDAVTGRMIVEINELSKAGMAMEAVGYIEGEDKQKGIDACTLWQTRMFEESKLCYAAEVLKGTQFKIIISVDDESVLPPVAGQ